MELVNIRDTAEKLACEISRSCYKSKIDSSLTSGFAACDFSSMGADQNDFENDIKFPVPEGIQLVVNAADYGVVPNVKDNMRKKIQAVIEAVKALGEGKKKLVLPAGDLYFYDTPDTDGNNYAITITGIKDLYVDGSGTNIMMDDSLRGIAVIDCENIVLRNINLDRFDLPYFMGVIEHMDTVAREAIVTVNEGYPIQDNYPAREYLEFDAVTKEPRYHGNFLYNNTGVDGDVLDIKSFRHLGGRRCKIEFGCDITWAHPGTGFVMSRTIYGKDSMLIKQSNNIKVENVSIFCSPGMGIMGFSSENLYFNRVNVMCKPGTDRLMSVTADAMHFIDCCNDLHITNCLLENSHDDSLNIHGMYMMSTRIDQTLKRVKLAAARTVRFGKPNKNDMLTIPFKKDDKIELSKDKTLEFKALRTVLACEPADDYGYWVTFKEDISDTEVGDIFSNTTRTPKLVMKNCVLRNKRNRGVLIQTKDALLENNTFYNIIMTGIHIMTDCLNWYESLNPRNIRIRNNKFVNTNIKPNNFGSYGNADIDICVYAQGGIGDAGLIKDIVIENNAFVNSGNAAISINSAETVTAKKNFIFRPCSETVTSPANCAIFVSNSRELQLVDNCIIPDDESEFHDVCYGNEAESNSIIADNTVIYHQKN